MEGSLLQQRGDLGNMTSDPPARTERSHLVNPLRARRRLPARFSFSRVDIYPHGEP